MIQLKLYSLIVLLALPIVLLAQANKELAGAIEAINFQDFYTDVNYLASDELEGRGTATKGYALAADYVAASFKKNDLLPLGDGGTYFQNIPFVEGQLDKSNFNITVKGIAGEARAVYGENISILINPNSAGINQKHDLVFVGYGNVVSELEIDDYRGMDVKNKVVLVALGGPKKMKHRSFDDPIAKIRTAKQHGAVGVILYSQRGLLEGIMFKQIHKFLKEPQLAIADTSVSKPFIDMDIVAIARKAFIKEVLYTNTYKPSMIKKQMKQGEKVSFPMSSTFHCSIDVKKQDKSCKNVVGLLPGSDPTLRNEYVVVGAHLDHLGIGEPVKKDSIYNGMWDNATGVAAIMSMAQGFKEGGLKPKRSVIFVAYTGEEKGLLGSAYYAKKSNIPKGKIVANINIDMLGGMFETKQVIPIGYGHSNLKEAVDYAVEVMGMEVLVDVRTEQMYIERSDQLSFIKIGAPAIYYSSSANSINKTNEIGKDVEHWIKKVYHSPADDLSQPYSAETFVANIQLNLLTTYYVVSKLDKVLWDTDSWIYKKYKLGEKSKTEAVAVGNDY